MANTPLTLAELESFFLDWLAKEVADGRTQDRTLRYYRTWIKRFTAAAGDSRTVGDLIALDLERFKTGWHSVQAVQRLFNWGVKVGLLTSSPFRNVERPPLGERQRVLTPTELLTLLRKCRRPLRDILLATRLTLSRPQEIRALRWCNYREELSVFVLTEFKAKKRRKDGKRERILPVLPRLARLLQRLRRRNKSADTIFLAASGRPWTANALRLAVRRAARRAGLDRDGEEAVVTYTLRHTGGTEAMANGVPDRVLAELMGHTNTKTTARYQHPQTQHLFDAIQRATQRATQRRRRA